MGGLIVRVREVPRRTVLGDIDRRFDSLSGSHHQLLYSPLLYSPFTFITILIDHCFLLLDQVFNADLATVGDAVFISQFFYILITMTSTKPDSCSC